MQTSRLATDRRSGWTLVDALVGILVVTVVCVAIGRVIAPLPAMVDRIAARVEASIDSRSSLVGVDRAADCKVSPPLSGLSRERGE